MNEEDAYLFHQTPRECAKDLLAFVPIQQGDILYEPFKGEGAFYDQFPVGHPVLWTEIRQGLDYKTMTAPYDWVITNPPFRIDEGGTKENAFWKLLDHFSQHAQKGIAFLSNDKCFSALTPKRIKVLEERGFHLIKLILVSVKKWRGRYYFLIFAKQPGCLETLETNY